MDNDVTPNDMARELSVTPLQVRRYLRSAYGKLNKSVATRWKLTPAQVAAVRKHFGG